MCQLEADISMTLERSKQSTKDCANWKLISPWHKKDQNKSLRIMPTGSWYFHDIRKIKTKYQGLCQLGADISMILERSKQSTKKCSNWKPMSPWNKKDWNKVPRSVTNWQPISTCMHWEKGYKWKHSYNIGWICKMDWICTVCALISAFV